jgi:hypothetical protein
MFLNPLKDCFAQALLPSILKLINSQPKYVRIRGEGKVHFAVSRAFFMCYTLSFRFFTFYTLFTHFTYYTFFCFRFLRDHVRITLYTFQFGQSNFAI